MVMTNECPICTEKYTKTARRKVACKQCSLEYCTTCLRRYLETCTVSVTDEGDVRIPCMGGGCTSLLSRKFMMANLTPTFIQKVVRAREASALMDVEKALLSQPEVHREASAAKQAVANKPEVAELALRIAELHSSIQEAKNRREYLRLGLRPDLYLEGHDPYRQRHAQRNAARREDAEMRVKPDAKRPRFVHRCPIGECPGLLSGSYECLICHTKCCRSCVEPRGEGHECRPDALESIREIKRSCRPCPNPSCGLPTQRSHGCNQMWCVSCHKFWDWRTGEIQKGGAFHNPEYLRYLSSRPADRQGVGGCEDLGYRQVQTAFRAPSSLGAYTFWMNALRMRNHIGGARREIVRVRGPRDERNRDLAVRYLAGELTESRWEALVGKRKKRDDRNLEEVEGLEFLHIVLGDVIGNSIAEPVRELEFRATLRGAVAEFNSQMAALSKAYKMATLVVPEVETWGRSTLLRRAKS